MVLMSYLRDEEDTFLHVCIRSHGASQLLLRIVVFYGE